LFSIFYIYPFRSCHALQGIRKIIQKRIQIINNFSTHLTACEKLMRNYDGKINFSEISAVTATTSTTTTTIRTRKIIISNCNNNNKSLMHINDQQRLHFLETPSLFIDLACLSSGHLHPVCCPLFYSCC